VVLACEPEARIPSRAERFGLPRGGDVSDALDVGGLEAFRSLSKVELHRLTLVQAPVSILLDSREMNEDVFARRPLNKAISLGSVKPLNCTFLSHNPLLSNLEMQWPRLR